jgi:hypothetical protein
LAGGASRRGPFLRFTKRYWQAPYTGRNLKDRGGMRGYGIAQPNWLRAPPAEQAGLRGAALFAAQEAANGAEKSGVEWAGT